jgi:hypothetical protein
MTDVHEQTDIEAQAIGADTINYIYSGDEFYAPYDLKGLCVFGVIKALREAEENDPSLYDSSDPARLDRIAFVEDLVQKVVDAGMQYYPWGHTDSKRYDIMDLTDKVFMQLGFVGGTRGVVQANNKPGFRKASFRSFSGSLRTEDESADNPVTTRKVAKPK